MAEFAHLHLHTAYSLLDGAIRLQDLFPTVKQHGMDAVAMTDHGNMFGAIEFYKKAKDTGIKPIFGLETYVSAGSRKDKTNRRTFHLILLAKNEEGYRNLTYLSSMAWVEGMFYHPRIDKEILKARSGGLIGLSSCLGGELAQTLVKEGKERAREVAKEYASIFAPGDFFMELQPNGLAEQDIVNDELPRLSQQTGIPIVATNDCHYVRREDSKAHNVLMCIQTGKTMSDKGRLEHETDAYYIKTPAEMNASFSHVPQALQSTVDIARRCNVELKLGKSMLPRYPVPEGHDAASFMRKISGEGLEKRFAEKAGRGEKLDPDLYRERLAHELAVIEKMGFPGYFLIVWDFINHAKDKGIPVGPGRGSGAGSLVAYAMRITDLDPIPLHLLFERFLNPERVSMPDFDVDFCMNRRGEVIEYVKRKYGADHVAQIATYHQLKSRSVVRDVARALEIPIAEADKLAKLVPEPVQGKSTPIPEAIEKEPRLKELYETDPKVHQLLDYARVLEGLNRHAGMHAAGVVIADGPVWETVPCFTAIDRSAASEGASSRSSAGKEERLLVTQFSMENVEAAGLVKFDFLGLKTLTVLDIAQKLIRRESPEFALDKLRLDDADVYRMISAGDTTGVFQLESSGFKELLKKLKPDCFEDIIAAVALYRPGPLEGGMVDDFIERKHGRKKVEYLHPSLEGILKETYGVIVYQEQVMQAASLLAGYSLGRADLLRRAMGKKKKEVMEKEKAGFVEGCLGKGVDQTRAEEIFDLIEKFAGYGFNKSHSAAYALVTYQTAFVKRFYPAEFMAGLLTCDKDNTDAIVKFIAEAKDMGLAVLRPDVNESDADFNVVRTAGEPGSEPKTDKTDKKKGRHKPGAGVQKAIRFGLGAIRGVGEGAVESVLAARTEAGPFSSLYEFCERVDLRKVNKKMLEALTKSGAFDSLGPKVAVRGQKQMIPQRARVMAAIESAVERAQKLQKEKESGQTSLFDVFAPPPAPSGAPRGEDERYPVVEDWAPRQMLALEKEALGFYLSGHPLDRYAADLKRFADATTGDLDDKAHGTTVHVGGMIAELRERPLKSGAGLMAFLVLEDATGQVEVTVFSKAYAKHAEVLKSGEPLLITARVEKRAGLGKDADAGEEAVKAKLLLEEAQLLSSVRLEKSSRLEIRLNADLVELQQIDQMKALLEAHRSASPQGRCTTWLRFEIPKRCETTLVLPPEWSVSPTDDLLVRLERLFGTRVASLR